MVYRRVLLFERAKKVPFLKIWIHSSFTSSKVWNLQPTISSWIRNKRTLEKSYTIIKRLESTYIPNLEVIILLQNRMAHMKKIQIKIFQFHNMQVWQSGQITFRHQRSKEGSQTLQRKKFKTFEFLNVLLKALEAHTNQIIPWLLLKWLAREDFKSLQQMYRLTLRRIQNSCLKKDGRPSAWSEKCRWRRPRVADGSLWTTEDLFDTTTFTLLVTISLEVLIK